MNRRPGTTLIEVLVAIFVMGIGLLSLLTLFPMGALSMAQAIKDDRTAHATANADAVAEALGLRQDPTVTAALSNPNPSKIPLGNAPPNLSTLVGYDGPSYPVYVDPFGVYSALTPSFQNFVGGYASYGAAVPDGCVPRQTLNLFSNANNATTQTQWAMSWFALLDDVKFAQNGLAEVSTGEVERENGYSWAFLVRRPRLANASMVDLSIIVYNQRPLRLTSGLNPNEDPFQATFDVTQNAVTLTWNPAAGQTAPNIRAGGWILDASITRNALTGMPIPHGFFYRVREVTDTTLANGQPGMVLTIGTPIREFKDLSNPNTTTFRGVVIIPEGVVEVFEKRMGWRP